MSPLYSDVHQLPQLALMLNPLQNPLRQTPLQVPLQGSDAPLQGSNAPLQGSGTSLQNPPPQPILLENTSLQGSSLQHPPLQGQYSLSLQPSQPRDNTLTYTYFHNELCLTDNKQLSRLIKAVGGFVSSPKFDIKSLNEIWSKQMGIFETAGENQSKVCRLFRGHKKIIKNKLSFCADTFTRLFLLHEVNERIYTSAEPLRKGLRRSTVAWNSVADELKKEPKTLMRITDTARCYLQLFEDAGPGDLIVFKSTEAHQ
jgi:hypothetical protein